MKGNKFSRQAKMVEQPFMKWQAKKIAELEGRQFIEQDVKRVADEEQEVLDIISNLEYWEQIESTHCK